MKEGMTIDDQLEERGIPTLLADEHPQISRNASHYTN
jgi:hypothetical protein